jgi:hypothetical protein
MRTRLKKDRECMRNRGLLREPIWHIGVAELA